ncbi:S8 family serine peptidase [Adhaeretor mobilis]|uniref:Uncharacterized protein n=1 Tax=Adhaeretor mobilis TaxID=1930276 RepID=A0A517N3A1_9BACT|nr:S8 family serine peptidase [Adhaeretor mobilis]QDT01620.1 hypothetical protein HG15A2_49670 [Adhaeretor mobilis]
MSFVPTADATYRDLIGFPELEAQLGASIPTGAGIEVQQAEAPATNGGYRPDDANSDFTTPPKTITNVTLLTSGTGANANVSGHATNVARNFYGNNTSISPDVNQIGVFHSEDWMAGGMLNTGVMSAGNHVLPETTSARVSNHSWVGLRLNDTNYDAAETLEVLQRTDFVVEEDDLLVVAGVTPFPSNGNINADRPLLKYAFNEISVGLTSGASFPGTRNLSGIYVAGRTGPDIVAPGFVPDNSFAASSFATPMVSASVALLLETGQDGSLSNGMITNRTRVINHAETSEVIKAVLMAGADRKIDNARGDDLTDYVVDTTNNLDIQYGAGQVNIFNSYNILAGGEQDSAEDGGALPISDRGWDYDDSFGGSGGSNSTGTYRFTAGNDDNKIQSTLVWNADIGISGATITADVEDFNLELFDVTISTMVDSSTSVIHNTENISFDGLEAGHLYELRVSSASLADWDYALAWQITGVPEPSTALLAACGLAAISIRRRR